MNKKILFALQERPDLSEMKAALMVGNAKMRSELIAIEDCILELLSKSEGNILDNTALIETLAEVRELFSIRLRRATLSCLRS